MKTEALSPEKALDKKDSLYDVQTEAIVVVINCILARNYQAGDRVPIPYAFFADPNIGRNILNRFLEAGWSFSSDNYANAMFFKR
jgi:hypothetical protein